MAARHMISSCCDKHRMQRGCWVQPASVISVLSMVALLVLQQCAPTSSAAAATAAVVDTARITARNSRATVTAPPADYSSSAQMLRPLTRSVSVLETHLRQRMLHQQPAATNVSGGSINTAAALDTQQDGKSCVEKHDSDTHAYCKRSNGCERFCNRGLTEKRCICCRPGHSGRKHKVWKSPWPDDASVHCLG